MGAAEDDVLDVVDGAGGPDAEAGGEKTPEAGADDPDTTEGDDTEAGAEETDESVETESDIDSKVRQEVNEALDAIAKGDLDEAQRNFDELNAYLKEHVVPLDSPFKTFDTDVVMANGETVNIVVDNADDGHIQFNIVRETETPTDDPKAAEKLADAAAEASENAEKNEVPETALDKALQDMENPELSNGQRLAAMVKAFNILFGDAENPDLAGDSPENSSERGKDSSENSAEKDLESSVDTTPEKTRENEVQKKLDDFDGTVEEFRETLKPDFESIDKEMDDMQGEKDVLETELDSHMDKEQQLLKDLRDLELSDDDKADKQRELRRVERDIENTKADIAELDDLIDEARDKLKNGDEESKKDLEALDRLEDQAEARAKLYTDILDNSQEFAPELKDVISGMSVEIDDNLNVIVLNSDESMEALKKLAKEYGMNVEHLAFDEDGVGNDYDTFKEAFLLVAGKLAIKKKQEEKEAKPANETPKDEEPSEASSGSTGEDGDNGSFSVADVPPASAVETPVETPADSELGVAPVDNSNRIPVEEPTDETPSEPETPVEEGDTPEESPEAKMNNVKNQASSIKQLIEDNDSPADTLSFELDDLNASIAGLDLDDSIVLSQVVDFADSDISNVGGERFALNFNEESRQFDIEKKA